jgi:thiol:disulfide interchange protein DsbG
MTRLLTLATWAAIAFLAIRGLISIHQQLTGPPPAPQEQPALAAPAGPALLTREQRRERAQRLVEHIGDGQARAEEVFTAPSGLTGVVIDTGSGKVVGWLPDTHEVLFIGAAFDVRGRNISQAEMLARGFAQPSEAPATGAGAVGANIAVFTALERAAGFVEGRRGPLIMALVDPECAFCSKLWRLTRQPIAEGRLRVRWIPVAIVAPTSEGRAAALLAAADPVRALTAQEMRTDRGGGTGGLAPPTHEQRIQLGANNALLAAVTGGKPATPTLVSRGADGAPIVTSGVPPDWPQFLAALR